MFKQMVDENNYVTTVKNNIESYIGKRMSTNQKTLGVVFAYCEYMSEKDVKKLEKYMADSQPGIEGKSLFDYNCKILCILLENRDLNYAHYYSLILHEYLVATKKLSGNIVVSDGSVSQLENQEIVDEMICKTKQKEETDGEIIVYSSKFSKRKGLIVIVDSSKENGQLLKNFFEVRGYIVFSAKDVAGAKTTIKECMPDIVITGLHFEGFSGYEILECATENKNFKKKSKVVILTNSKNEMDIKRSFELGASDYLTKPYSLVELEVRVKRLMETMQ